MYLILELKLNKLLNEMYNKIFIGIKLNTKFFQKYTPLVNFHITFYNIHICIWKIFCKSVPFIKHLQELNKFHMKKFLISILRIYIEFIFS